ncbi:MAG: RNA polymerase factor sigma-54, partial [Planctomycetota bacterium]
LLATDLETILAQCPNIPDVELSLALLERGLREVQFWLDPPGIAARSVQEALLLQIDDLQLRDDNESNDWDDVRLLIEEHLDDLLQNRLPRISQKTHFDMDRIQAAMTLMRQLKPKPGRGLIDVDVPPIIPDVVVEYDEHRDEYIAALRDGLLPVLRISNRYEEMARDRQVDKDTRDFVANNVRSATWLIESIRQRNSTLLRVVNVVLTRQRGFFDEGPQALRPLPMTEVADQLGVDVSTVSRAVADKWMQTPRGIYPLRRFFSGGTSTESGQDMSWEAVKATLKEIVDGEDKSRPFSDEALSQELKKRGIDIARRTVVKYRQQLDIPPARRRKVFA